MLTTDGWQHDAAAAAVDPSASANDYSYDYLSRLDFTRVNGARFDCENLRVGCAGQTAPSAGCSPSGYSFVGIDVAAEPSHTCQIRS